MSDQPTRPSAASTLELLKRIEHACPDRYDRMCPACGHYDIRPGHAPDCALAAHIRAYEAAAAEEAEQATLPARVAESVREAIARVPAPEGCVGRVVEEAGT